MKKIIILSALSFRPCVLCSLIRLSPLEGCQLQIIFVRANFFLKTVEMVFDAYDLIVGIGFRATKEAAEFGNKLLILSQPLDDEEFIPIFFAEKIAKSNLSLMTRIVEIGGCHNVSEHIFDLDLTSGLDDLSELLSDSKFNLDKEISYTKRRYERALKVVRNVHPKRDEITFHRFFLEELVSNEANEWIEGVLSQYDFIEDETKRLIKEIRPDENIPTIGLLTATCSHFFKDDIITASEKLGHLITAIEYVEQKGHKLSDVTLLFEKCIKEPVKYPNKIKDNWSLITSSLN